MRILMMSEAASVHTWRWAVALQAQGLEVGLYSFDTSHAPAYRECGIEVYPAGVSLAGPRSLWGKWRYLRTIPALRRAIRQFRPHLVHAHFATHHGLLAALSGFHPFVLSVWGSDVYTLPRTIPLGRPLLRYTLRRADRLLSTSHAMAREAAKYTDKPFVITPFGVDTSLFHPVNGIERDPHLFGCTKSLEPAYGHEVLLQAFAHCVQRNPERPLRLELAGTGSLLERLQALAHELGIAERVSFLGYLPNGQLPQLYSRWVAAVFPTVVHESFGVVAVEAMACGCPVVATECDGFQEVLRHGDTGYLVPQHDVEALASAMQCLLDAPAAERARMGQCGIERVRRLFQWQDSVQAVIREYTSLLPPR